MHGEYCRPSCPCTATQSAHVAKAFAKAGGLKSAARCPNSSAWLERIALHSGQRAGDVLVIGCNKGDGAVGFLRMLTGNMSYSSRSWYDALVTSCNRLSSKERCPQGEYKEGQSWNVCGPETVMARLPQHVLQANTEVICVEALPATAGVLTKATLSLGWPLHIVHAAVVANATNPTRMFPNSLNFGTENLGLSGQGQNWALWKKANRAHNASGTKIKYPVVHVPALTVDMIVERRQRPVEALLIDAEGHDPDVLHGASHTLQSQSLGYIEFEVSWGGAWKHRSVSSVVTMLDSYGFDCFWAGQTLYPITRCWHQNYENIGSSFGNVWGNIACAHRRHPRWLCALWSASLSTFSELSCSASGQVSAESFMFQVPNPLAR